MSSRETSRIAIPDSAPDYPKNAPNPLEPSGRSEWANHAFWHPQNYPLDQARSGVIFVEHLEGKPRGPYNSTNAVDIYRTAAGIIKLGEMGLQPQLDAMGFLWERAERVIGEGSRERRIDQITMRVPTSHGFCQGSNAFVAQLSGGLNRRMHFDEYDGAEFSYAHLASKLGKRIRPIGTDPIATTHDVFFHAPGFAALSVIQTRMLGYGARYWAQELSAAENSGALPGYVGHVRALYTDFMEFLDRHIWVEPVIKLLEGDRGEARAWADLIPNVTYDLARRSADQACSELAAIGKLAASQA